MPNKVCAQCGRILAVESTAESCPECESVAQESQAASKDSISARAGSLAETLEMCVEEDELPSTHCVPSAERTVDTDVPEYAGRYRIIDELARGGMGCVLRAHDPGLDRTLAVKIMVSTGNETAESEKRFLEEARITGKLQHPGIPPVHELGRLEDGRPFFVMKLIDGQTLHELLRQRKDPAQELLRFVEIFEHVCRTIGYAHSQGYIHRDLKPLNIMVGAFGEVQVMDWGLAKRTHEPQAASSQEEQRSTYQTSAYARGETSQRPPIASFPSSDRRAGTLQGLVLGTPAYMAPEQAAGNIQATDARADVFGLGAVLCEILTGKPPYVAESRIQVFQLASQASLNSCFRRLDASYADPELVQLAKRCLAFEREHRPNDADVVSEAVSEFLKSVLERSRLAEIERVKTDAIVAAEEKRRDVVQALAIERERRKINAIEKVQLAAHLGDFETALEAIDEAEHAGSDQVQIAWLRGLAELYGGRLESATGHFEEAIASDPENVTALSLLALTLGTESNWTDYFRIISRLRGLPAVTAADLLYRGHAESLFDPASALKLLDEALQRQPSSQIIRYLRLETLTLYLVYEYAELDQAKLAMEDARMLRTLIRNSPHVLSVSLLTNIACANVASLHGDATLHAAATAAARLDFEALADFPEFAEGVSMRLCFVRELASDDSGAMNHVLNDALSIVDQTSHYGTIDSCATHFYIEGEFEKAEAILSKCEGNFLAQMMRALAMTEQKDGWARASAVCDTVDRRDLSQWDLFNSQLLLRFLGRRDEAVEVSRQFLREPEKMPEMKTEWFRSALQYCAEEISESQLLAAAENSRSDRCGAHFFIGLTALVAGRREAARDHFQQCIDTLCFLYLPYTLSRMFLSRMRQVESWPTWISPSI